MNYTEEELCTLVDQLPDIQYNLHGTLTVAEPLILKNVDYNAMVLS